MAGVSKKTPLPCWQFVMDNAGWETAAEMSRAMSIPESTCRSYIYDGVVPSMKKIAAVDLISSI